MEMFNCYAVPSFPLLPPLSHVVVIFLSGAQVSKKKESGAVDRIIFSAHRSFSFFITVLNWFFPPLSSGHIHFLLYFIVINCCGLLEYLFITLHYIFLQLFFSADGGRDFVVVMR